MDSITHKEYTSKLLELTSTIGTSSTNPLKFIDMVIFFIYQGLGKQALAVLKLLVMELTSLEMNDTIQSKDMSYPSQYDLIILHFLISKISAKFCGYYEPVRNINSIIDSYSDSPIILAHAAIYFHNLNYFDEAEQLYVASLLLMPDCDIALYRYSHLLFQKGLFLVAQKYLSRINQQSILFWLAKIESNWCLEMLCYHQKNYNMDYKSTSSSNKPPLVPKNPIIKPIPTSQTLSPLRRSVSPSLTITNKTNEKRTRPSSASSAMISRSRIPTSARSSSSSPDNQPKAKIRSNKPKPPIMTKNTSRSTSDLQPITNNGHKVEYNKKSSSLDSMLLGYQACVKNENIKHRSYALSLHSLGYHHHLRTNNFQKAKEYYNRAIKNDEDDYIACLLNAMLSNTINMITTPSNVDVSNGATINNNVASHQTDKTDPNVIDSYYRRSLLLTPSCIQYNWIICLSYADFLCYSLEDYYNAELMYISAVQHASTQSCYPYIALIQFYMYIKRDMKAAKHYLYHSLQKFPIDISLRASASSNKPRNPINKHIRHKIIALKIVESYYFIETHQYNAATDTLKFLLTIDSKSDLVCRCLSLVLKLSNRDKLSLKFIDMACQIDASNPFNLKTYAALKMCTTPL
eukprot:gene13186-17669_t